MTTSPRKQKVPGPGTPAQITPIGIVAGSISRSTLSDQADILRCWPLL
jgi:hypothetical protein